MLTPSNPQQPVIAGRGGSALAARSAWLLAGVLVLLATLAAQIARSPGTVSPPERAASRSPAALAGLPESARGQISAQLGAGDPANEVRAGSAGIRAMNRAQGLRARFGPLGVEVASGPTTVRMLPTAIGYGSSRVDLGRAAPRARANRVVYAYRSLVAWYANGPLGLEQGFTVAHAPGAEAGGALTLSLRLSGNAHATALDGGRRLVIASAGGRSLLYDGLVARDARGRTLRSRLQTAGDRLLIRVAASGARYPLQIDPLIHQGEKLTGQQELGRGDFGWSVALSADGNTALIGGICDNPCAGAAWVFTRSGSSWTQQAKLTGSQTVRFGSSVALSADGDTALVGSPYDNQLAGSAWVFTRTGSTWTEQQRLAGAGESGEGEFGSSVSLSGDGDTALVGAPNDNGASGAAWAFTRSGTSWTQQGDEKLTGHEAGRGFFGSSVALSADASTALIGAHNAGMFEGTGAAWVFTNSGSMWVQQATLTGAGELGTAHFGWSVALSASGDTALVGGPWEEAGAVWVFARSGSSWSQQGERLIGNELRSLFGDSVALSADGNTALIGGPYNGTSGLPGEVRPGAAWLYTRSGTIWTRRQELAARRNGEEVGRGEFGAGVSLSEDGQTALIGGYADHGDLNGGPGGAWAFTSVPSVPPPEVTGVSPAKTPEAGGGTVTITGSNLAEATSVYFGSTRTSDFTEVSPEELVAIAPPGLGTVDVTAATPGGTSATSAADRVRYTGPPVVSALSPQAGPFAGGIEVTITGRDFTEATAVRFGSAAATFTVESDSTITAVLPPGSGTVHVTVTTPEGTSLECCSDMFTYLPPPVLTKRSPSAGPVDGGTKVTLAGSNFGWLVAVKFGAIEATNFAYQSGTKLVVYSPPAPAGKVEITVTTLGGTSVTSERFAYKPTITALSPSSGPRAGGTSVTVTGSGFTPGAGGTAFKFGRTAATHVNCASSTECLVVAPAHEPGTVDVKATVNKVGSAAKVGDRFSYL